MDRSRIEWTDATWNPVTGCDEVSRGCDNCYARRLAERFRGVPGHPFERGFDVTLRPERLGQPSRWRRPRRVFVCSMADLFHKAVPDAHLDRVFLAMEAAPRHHYQVLTKRSSRLRDFVRRTWGAVGAPPNVWCGVSVEDAAALVRVRHLREARCAVRWLSLEPLLGPLDGLDLDGISWVVAGGESGPGARPMDPRWAADARDLCAAAGVPFFFKQWGGRTPKAGGRLLDGRTHDAMPSAFARG